MLHVQLDEEAGMVTLVPGGQLQKSDFEQAAALVDPLIHSRGSLAGLIIHVEHFPGWGSFASLTSHLSFVKNHHQKIERIAFVTDSPVGAIAEKIAGHFVAASIRVFAYSEISKAREWIQGEI